MSGAHAYQVSSEIFSERFWIFSEINKIQFDYCSPEIDRPENVT